MVLYTVITSGRNHKQILELAIKNRLPTMFSERDLIESGGLCPMVRTILTYIAAPPSS